MDTLVMDTRTLQGAISQGRGGLVDLSSPEVVASLSSICEAILLGKKAVIHTNGPALAVVTLVRWMGKDLMVELMTGGMLAFVFTPTRLFTYKDGRMAAVSAVADPKKDDFHNDVALSIEFPLHHQINMSRPAAGRFAQRVLEHTLKAESAISDKEIPELVDQASGILGVAAGDLYGLSQGDPLILPLLNLAEQAARMELALQVGIPNVLHSPPRWELGQKKSKPPAEAAKLEWLLKHEGFPDVDSMVRSKDVIPWLLALRQDGRYPYWLEMLRDLPGSEPEAIADYFRKCREMAQAKWSERLPTKIFRFAAGLLLSPVLGAASPIFTLYDSVGSATSQIDKMQRYFNPNSGLGTFLLDHKPPST